MQGLGRGFSVSVSSFELHLLVLVGDLTYFHVNCVFKETWRRSVQAREGDGGRNK